MSIPTNHPVGSNFLQNVYLTDTQITNEYTDLFIEFAFQTKKTESKARVIFKKTLQDIPLFIGEKIGYKQFFKSIRFSLQLFIAFKFKKDLALSSPLIILYWLTEEKLHILCCNIL